MQEDGQIEKNLSLREAYNKYLHPDVLPIKEEKYWDVISKANVLSLFQLDSSIGRLGAKKVKPSNMIELSSVNGLIRLMTAEKGEETWLDKYVRYKNNKDEYYKDIAKYNLTTEELECFNKYVGMTNGIGISQEQFMRSVMDPNICNFSLKEANAGRKVISKKKMKEIPKLKEQVFSKAKNINIANYIWDYIVAPGLGYSFSDIHSISYSFIGFQTAYLATRWNSIYWNTACLVVNSGALEGTEGKNTNYAKIAKAIGEVKKENINVSLININESDYSFKPDVKNNRILYGLKALGSINPEIIEQIKSNRPYLGIADFINRCPLGKTAMVNLIKAGAFDEVETVLNNRKEIMAYYLWQVCDKKSKLTMQNFNGLITHSLIPKTLELQIRVFNYNKYLKSYKKQDNFVLNEMCVNFMEKFLPDYLSLLKQEENEWIMNQKEWDKAYKELMTAAKVWLMENHDYILKEYNQMLFKELWDKYAAGTVSAWEMASVCFYHSPHELINVNRNKYGVSNFSSLSIVPPVDKFFKRNGIQIPIYKLTRIMGTVIAKTDARNSFSLLTTDGVVDVKVSRDYYAQLKKQISQIQPDGTKKVIEKSWLQRGSKLIITGYRREDTFVAKTYANTNSHQVYKITEVCEDSVKITHDRVTPSGAYFEEEVPDWIADN